MPLVKPNFAGTDANGKFYSSEDAIRSLSYRNALCVGTIAVEGVRYFPIQARHRGGEKYYDDNGNVQYRLPGELRYERVDDVDKPVFLLRRELAKTAAYYPSRKDISNQIATSSGVPPEIKKFLDNAFEYQFIDGSPCPIGLPPSISNELALVNWATTLDIDDAQYAYDLFLCPKLAEGEPLPPSVLVSVEREQIATFKVPFRNKHGEDIDPISSGVVNQQDVRYFEVLPPTDRYFTTLKGQATTHGFPFTTAFDPSHGDYPYTFADTQPSDLIIINCNSNKKTLKIYANAALDRNGKIVGTLGKVVNTVKTFPSRGYFTIKTHEMFFDVLFSLATERGFGVPCTMYVNRFINGVDYIQKIEIYYTIVRRLLDPTNGRYVLELLPTEPYMHTHEIEHLRIGFEGSQNALTLLTSP
jgi:hypothetical protein